MRARFRPDQRGEARTLVALTVGLLIGVATLAVYRMATRDIPTQDELDPLPERGSQSTDKNDRSSPAERRTDQPAVARGGESHGLPAVVRPIDGAVLHVRDAENEATLAGVRAYDTQQRREVGISDETGKIELQRTAAGHLILHGEGCLARILPVAAQRTLANEKRALVRVYRDRYTIGCDVRFEGAAEGDVSLVFAPVEDRVEVVGFPTDRTGPGFAVSNALRRAWEEHRMLVDQVAVRGVAWHLRRQLLPHVVPASGVRVRFAQAREYEVRARQSGRIARARVRLRTTSDNALRLRFRQGDRLQVVVSCAQHGALAGARVGLEFPDVPQEPEVTAETDADGRAELAGLLLGDRVRLRVLLDGYEPHDRELVVRDGPHRVVLRPLPALQHVIRIVERGSKRPVSGVTALLGQPEEPLARFRSDASGTARLRWPGSESRLLTLRHPDFVEYQEMLDAGATALPGSFELVPKARDRQRAAGLICVVSGSVHRDGKPLGGVLVALLPQVDDKGKLVAGSIHPSGFLPVGRGVQRSRMVVRGLLPEARTQVKTDEQGRFELFSLSAGRARVAVMREGGVQRDVVLTLGHEVSVRL